MSRLLDPKKNGVLSQREHARDRQFHGMTNHPLYDIWKGMVRRCTDPRSHAWKLYGGRGITVCERWLNVGNFIVDMGERPADTELDRIDNDGPYSPDNCRWANFAQQSRNRRTNAVITFGGKTQCITDWAADIGITSSSLRKRFRDGWPIDKALTRPGHPGKPR